MGWHSEQARLRQVEAGGDRKSEEYRAQVEKSLVAPVQQPVEEPATTAAPMPQAQEPIVIHPERASAFEQKAISQAGKQFHVSGRSVAAAKTILEHGTPEEIKAVETGQAALKPVEQQVRERIREEQQAIQSTVGVAPRRSAKAMFNATTDSVEWARKWEGGMDPVEYVVSKNIHRRQLTPAQRAMCAAKAMGWHSEQAKLRQVEAGKEHAANLKQFADDRLVAPVQQAEEPAAPAEPTPSEEPEVIHPERASAFEQKAISQAGKQFHVSGRSVAAAKTILEHGTQRAVFLKSLKNSLAAKGVREHLIPMT